MANGLRDSLSLFDERGVLPRNRQPRDKDQNHAVQIIRLDAFRWARWCEWKRSGFSRNKLYTFPRAIWADFARWRALQEAVGARLGTGTTLKGGRGTDVRYQRPIKIVPATPPKVRAVATMVREDGVTITTATHGRGRTLATERSE